MMDKNELITSTIMIVALFSVISGILYISSTVYHCDNLTHSDLKKMCTDDVNTMHVVSYIPWLIGFPVWLGIISYDRRNNNSKKQKVGSV